MKKNDELADGLAHDSKLMQHLVFLQFISFVFVYLHLVSMLYDACIFILRS
jgi:hypothetical protein